MRIFEKEQRKICEKYDTTYFPSPENFKVGISLNVKEGVQPIHGLRRPVEKGTCGWYIWAGEELSQDPDFFVPLHVSHLPNWSPQIIKYLGLPPGYRFLIDDKGY